MMSLLKEMSSFQGCPYRGVPLYSLTSLHIRTYMYVKCMYYILAIYVGPEARGHNASVQFLVVYSLSADYRIAENFQGRKLSRIGRKGAFYGEKKAFMEC